MSGNYDIQLPAYFTLNCQASTEALNLPAKPAFILRVAVPSPLRKLFDYLPDPDVPLPEPGCRVRVPFGRQTVVGMVVSVESDTDVDVNKLKRISALIDHSPLLDGKLLQLYLWAGRYYMYPPGQVLQTSLPAAIREGKPAALPPRKVWTLTATGRAEEDRTLAKAPLQQKVLELLRRYACLSGAEVSAALGKNASAALRALADKALIEQTDAGAESESAGQRSACEAPHALNPEQAAALRELLPALGAYHCALLEGITGSGKTEIYLQLIGRVLQQGKQVLVLVPEISLTPQTIDRFTRRFACPLVSFHSALTARQRFEGWVKAYTGKAQIIIGTRSAVFTPMPRPGLIIVDEEHDDSYKQQDGFRYSARDVAVYRAHQLKIPVLLGSATPSLETLANALQGRYRHLQVHNRAGSARTPEIRLIDMKLQEAREGFSALLQNSIHAHLDAGRQVLVFLNRRGFAPLLQCQSCGWIAECPRCERSYTLHQQPAGLRCHHCESIKGLPPNCPTCGGTHLGGIGQGTERSEAFLRSEFPDFPVIRIDRDSTRAVGSLQEKIDTVQRGEPCILVGTQMLAKGHHFPRVTLVAVLDADSGLFSADFRGQENLGQLLTQVAGRAGRSDHAGQVLVQSFNVNHPGLLQLVREGYGAFARSILAQRKLGELPPFSRFIMLRAEASRRELPRELLERARGLLETMPGRGIQVYGPMPSPIGKKAGLFRYQLILQSANRTRLQRTAHELIKLLEKETLARKVRWQVDVDPVDFS